MKRKKYLTPALQFLLGIGVGLLMLKCVSDERLAHEANLLAYTLGCVGMYTLHILVHEAGHMVGGLLSGYRFSSFRVGSFMLLRRDGKWLLRRYYLPGTLGQCLMSPPEWRDGMPFRLYHAGGALANLLTAILLWLVAVSADLFLASVLRCLALTALLTALSNAIPRKTNTVQNDGQNILDLGRDPLALRLHWMQLKLSAMVVEQSDEKVDSAWFILPDDADLSNPWISWALSMECAMLMSEMDFDAARKRIEEVLASGANFTGINRMELIADLALCEMLGENRPEEVDRLLDKATLKQFRKLSVLPGFLRTLYAYELLRRQDYAEAAKLSARLNRMAPNYAYPGSIEKARAYIALVDEKAAFR